MEEVDIWPDELTHDRQHLVTATHRIDHRADHFTAHQLTDALWFGGIHFVFPGDMRAQGFAACSTLVQAIDFTTEFGDALRGK